MIGYIRITENMPRTEKKEEKIKYRYKIETFAIDEDIEIPPDAKILKSCVDSACNHHEYEGIEKDTITIQWLEPIRK